MGHEERGGTGPRGGGRWAVPRAAYRELDDAALVDAMRRVDERAVDEFIMRHQRLLHDRARQWRVALEDVEDCIANVVEDVAILIVSGRIRPTSLAAYVVKVFRVRLAALSRAEGERRRVESDAATDAEYGAEGAIVAAVSESTRHASRGAGWEPLPIPGAVLRLARLLDEGLTSDERRILTWLGNFVPQREICAWLGLSYAAGTQRIWRLRERLRRAARAHAARFDPQERAELERFLGRMEPVGAATRPRSPRSAPDSRGGLDEGA